jgi:hypothetical protein
MPCSHEIVIFRKVELRNAQPDTASSRGHSHSPLAAQHQSISLERRSHLTSSSSRRDRRLEKGRLALTTVTQRSLAVPDGMQKCSGVPLAWLNVAYLILTSPEQFFVLKRVLTEVQMRL